jgi:hypothetical protein
MSKKNIVEVYIEQKKKFIIVLVGLPGSDIEQISIDLSKNLNFNMINTVHYLKNKNIQNINDFDIKKLNTKINILKKKGLVICTNFFPKKFINSKIDYTFLINITKKKSIQKNPKLSNNFFTLYYEELKNTHINKYINIKNDNDVYNDIFNTLMEYISCKLDDGNYKNKITCKKTYYNTDSDKSLKTNSKEYNKNNKPKKKNISDSNTSDNFDLNTSDPENINLDTSDSDTIDLNTSKSDNTDLNTSDSENIDLNTSESENADLNTSDDFNTSDDLNTSDSENADLNTSDDFNTSDDLNTSDSENADLNLI